MKVKGKTVKMEGQWLVEGKKGNSKLGLMGSTYGV